MSTRPNLLFLFPDQWRWDWLGCEDSPFGKVPVRTPNLDALAARGVRFTQCRTNSPVCAPARACLAQGLRYERCGVPSNRENTALDAPNIFKALRDAGYRTMTCGKSDLRKGADVFADDGFPDWVREIGFSAACDQRGKMNGGRPPRDKPGPYMAYLRAQGMMQAHIDDYERRQHEATWATSPWPAPFDREHFTDDFCARQALRLLDASPNNADGENPWLLWVNFPGPHDPHDAPRELQQRYDGVTFSDPIEGLTSHRQHHDVDHQQLRRNYAASCEGLDEWVGRIIDAVTQRGELDNTLIVFASDHGEMLGDHGRWAKSIWYEPSVHVPLIVAGPNVKQGAVSEALVELIDVGATLLDAAGVVQLPEADAKSLRPILRGEATTHRDLVHSALGNWRLVCDGRHKLVRTEGEPDRLFDLEADPAEQHDLAPERPELAHALARRIGS